MDSLDPYPDRRAHWIRLNHTERTPHRWIVADSEAFRDQVPDGEVQTLRCVDAVRWRDDLTSGDQAEDYAGDDAAGFWQWVDEWTRAGTRTVLWFHNASYDLRTLDAFRQLPLLGWQLDWCNLDRDVSVATWRSSHGTLVIADTWTWLAKPLADVAGMVGIGKPQLPDDDDSLPAWHARCQADVRITRAAVLELLSFVRSEHLGNWQPSGAGMGYATWRHRFLTHKVLVHDDAPALAAERAAMHAGRAEAWHHGKSKRGPFTEWDMHMSYCRIAAECAVPARLYAYDPKPSRRVHEWARQHWTLLCRVKVHTDVPVVPCQTGERTVWPVGEFETTLWQPELDLVLEAGGSYEVLEQWRYIALPVLKDWAEWSIASCDPLNPETTPVQKAWVKHQSRALIGRLALRNASWQQWGANPYGWCGLTELVDAETGETQRMMHVGDRTFVEGERRESGSSLPQITGWIMAEARVRLWHACQAAGLETVQHVDTDSLIVNRDGDKRLQEAARAGLSGSWRPKEHWARLDVVGPRHYHSSGRRVIPGMPVTAVETEPGVFRGEVWESLATSLENGRGDQVKIHAREWRPKRFDGRRPWTGEGPAEPIRLPADSSGKETGDRTDDGGAAGARSAPGGRPVVKRLAGAASGRDRRHHQSQDNATGDPGRGAAGRGARRTKPAQRPAKSDSRAAAAPAAAAARRQRRKVSNEHTERQRAGPGDAQLCGYTVHPPAAGRDGLVTVSVGRDERH